MGHADSNINVKDVQLRTFMLSDKQSQERIIWRGISGFAMGWH